MRIYFGFIKSSYLRNQVLFRFFSSILFNWLFIVSRQIFQGYICVLDFLFMGWKERFILDAILLDSLIKFSHFDKSCSLFRLILFTSLHDSLDWIKSTFNDLFLSFLRFQTLWRLQFPLIWIFSWWSQINLRNFRNTQIVLWWDLIDPI